MKLTIATLVAVGSLALGQTVDTAPRALAKFTIAAGANQLPTASSWTDRVAEVSDGASACDVTVGGGTTRVIVLSNGTSWTAPNCGGSGGGSVFTGSTAVTSSFSATPTFSLADVSSKSPTRFEPAAMTANVTSVTYTNKTAGAKFSIVWLQDGTGGWTKSEGASSSNTCTVSPTASKYTEQFYEVAADGTTVYGTGCISNDAADTPVTLPNLQSGAPLYLRSTTGNDTYVAALTPTLTAYTRGQCFNLDPDTANTGTATINIDSLGAKSILTQSGGALADGDITANKPKLICYDGTQFIIQGDGAGSGSSTTITGGAWFLWGEGYTGGGGLSLAGSTPTAKGIGSFAFKVDNPVAIKHLVVNELVAATSNCGGGAAACGLVISIKPVALTSNYCVTTVITGGGSPDLNTTGFKNISFASGTGVSGGTCTLPVGMYFLQASSDSTDALFESLPGDASPAYSSANATQSFGYISAAIATGSGATLAIPADTSPATGCGSTCTYTAWTGRGHFLVVADGN